MHDVHNFYAKVALVAREGWVTGNTQIIERRMYDPL